VAAAAELAAAEEGQAGAAPLGEEAEGQDAMLGGAPGESEDEDEDNPEVEAHARNEDRAVPERQRSHLTRGDGASEAAVAEPCCLGVPMAMSAGIVVLLDVVEAGAALQDVWWVGWYNALLAGLILKWMMLVLLLGVGEGVLRSHWFCLCGCFGMPLQLWVKAHRMARDMFVSSLIMAVLSPVVLLNYCNEKLCPGCSVHQLLIYRDPGHLARKEAIIVDMADEEPSPRQGDDLFEEGAAPPSGVAMVQPAPPRVVV